MIGRSYCRFKSKELNDKISIARDATEAMVVDEPLAAPTISSDRVVAIGATIPYLREKITLLLKLFFEENGKMQNEEVQNMDLYIPRKLQVNMLIKRIMHPEVPDEFIK
ncbi:hypothetical protein Tco_0754105 [Tanacetum coccineum]